MSSSGSARTWISTWLIAIATGAIAGALAACFIVSPALHRTELAVQDALRLFTAPATSSTRATDVKPLEASLAEYEGLPAALRTGRASPTLPLFRVDARSTAERVFLSEQIGTVVALTEDGWVVTTEAAVPANARLADLGVGWKGALLTPSKGLRDRSSGLVFLKVEAHRLAASALVSRFEVEIGQPVWTEGRTNEYRPTFVTRLGFAGTSTTPLLSDQWNRRFFLAESSVTPATAVWDGYGRLIGLADTKSERASLIPADAIRSALTSLLANGDIRRPFLGVRYLDLAEAFAARPGTQPTATKGALLTGSRVAPALLANGPAALALREGDIIERVDQDVLDGSWTLAEHVLEYRPGAAVTIAGLRAGKPFDARVTFGSTTTSEVLK